MPKSTTPTEPASKSGRRSASPPDFPGREMKVVSKSSNLLQYISTDLHYARVKVGG